MADNAIIDRKVKFYSKQLYSTYVQYARRNVDAGIGMAFTTMKNTKNAKGKISIYRMYYDRSDLFIFYVKKISENFIEELRKSVYFQLCDAI
jgi:hypothetical protein